MKAAEDVLSEAFKIVFEVVKDGLKKPCLLFVMSVLSALALKEALYNILDRSIENRAQPFSYMDVFSRSILCLTQFLWPAAKFIRNKVEEHAGKVLRKERTAEIPFSFPPSTSSSSETSF